MSLISTEEATHGVLRNACLLALARGFSCWASGFIYHLLDGQETFLDFFICIKRKATEKSLWASEQCLQLARGESGKSIFFAPWTLNASALELTTDQNSVALELITF